MNKHIVVALAVLSVGCSFIVDPEAQHRWVTPVDSGPPPPDAGTDAGPTIPIAPQLRFPWNGYMTGSALTGALPIERNALRPRFMWDTSPGAERYEIQLNLKNIADRNYYISGHGSVDNLILPGPGREVQLTLRAKF